MDCFSERIAIGPARNEPNADLVLSFRPSLAPTALARDLNLVLWTPNRPVRSTRVREHGLCPLLQSVGRDRHLRPRATACPGMQLDQCRAVTKTFRCSRLPDSPTDFRLRNCTFGQMPANSSRKQTPPRQQEVLDLLVQGMANKEIGARLGIGERGVKHHVSRLFALYAVSSRAELIAIVLGRKR